MLKVLRDITIGQIKDICDAKEICNNCPFESICGEFVYDWIINKTVILEDRKNDK